MNKKQIKPNEKERDGTLMRQPKSFCHRGAIFQNNKGLVGGCSIVPLGLGFIYEAN